MLKIILEEAVGMFSEALKIMDDNMYHYMADQYQAKVERQQAEIENQQVKIENLQTESFSLYFIFLTSPTDQLSGTACPHAAA